MVGAARFVAVVLGTTASTLWSLWWPATRLLLALMAWLCTLTLAARVAEAAAAAAIVKALLEALRRWREADDTAGVTAAVSGWALALLRGEDAAEHVRAALGGAATRPGVTDAGPTAQSAAMPALWDSTRGTLAKMTIDLIAWRMLR